MIQSTERGNRPRRSPRRSAETSEDLPYVIEMWNGARTKVERVIARAQSASLARAIFKAACDEHPSRYLILRRAERVLACSGD